MEQNPKQLVVERIKSATNILVTVSNNPSVDQLAACIGFTLMLNKLGKHATAVFSGMVPSTLEFLQPEKTLEKNTDSLQDFIIALDKSKADKLRYKVEDDVVRIFITPYRTSISEKDLEFSLGDFNVDAVVALGVVRKEEIDQAIVAHGRILHDATVMTVTTGETVSDVGSVNWHDQTASSLSEMLVSISESFQSGLLDPQMATSFLTGIVAETERFSNAKTSPKVMTMSAQLMAAGANQQLIATKLMPPEPEAPPAPPAAPNQPNDGGNAGSPPAAPPEPPKPDGELDIEHVEHGPIGAGVLPEGEEHKEDDIHIDNDGNLKLQAEIKAAEKAKQDAEAKENDDRAALEAAQAANAAQGGMPAAHDDSFNETHKVIEPPPNHPFDPLAPDGAMPQPTEPALNLPPVGGEEPAAPMPEPKPDETLAQLEQDVNSPHLGVKEQDPALIVDQARQAVATANLDVPPRPEPVQSLGAQPLDMAAQAAPAPEPTMAGLEDILKSTSSVDDAASALPPASVAQPAPAVPAPTDDHNLEQAPPQIVTPDDPLAPPPVPPPMTMPYFEPKTSHHNPYLNPGGDQPAAPSSDQPV